MVAKVLKSKYFRNSSFLEAKLQLSVCFMWSSIMEGRELLKQSLCWRIGNGRKVQVRMETWLMTPYDFKLVTKNPFLQNSLVEFFALFIYI